MVNLGLRRHAGSKFRNLQDVVRLQLLEAGFETQQQQAKIDISLVLSGLKACISVRDLQNGNIIHANAVENGGLSNPYVACTLINMYARCGSLVDAREVFDKMGCRSLPAWTSLMLGYVENGDGEEALNLFGRMQLESCEPDARAFLAAFKACTSLAVSEAEETDVKPRKRKALEKGLMVHSLAVRTGCDDIFLSSSLVDMYASCGSMVAARIEFERMIYHDVVAWNTLLLGYVENGMCELALELFSRMQREGCGSNDRTFLAVLQACANLAEREGQDVDPWCVKLSCLRKGMALHLQAKRRGYDSGIFVASTLVNMYAKCGSLGDARRVFDKMQFHNVVLWNTLLVGYGENGEGKLALDLFACMLQGNLKPDSGTFVAALKACSSLAGKEGGQRMAALEKGMLIQAEATRHSLDSDRFVKNTLLDLYVKCGSLEEAHRLFETMESRSAVPWTVLMLGYVENGQGERAMELYARMQREGCSKDARTYFAALKACISLAEKEEAIQIQGTGYVKLKCLEQGMVLHSEAAKRGCDDDIFVRSTLMDLYAKCGSLLDARGVFDKMVAPNIATCNALLLGYAENSEERLALDLLACIERRGRPAPDSRTFIACIKACGSLAVKEEAKLIEGTLLKVEALKTGRAVHSQAEARRLDSEPFVSSSLVDMYAKCGSLEDASALVAGRIQSQSVGTLNALLLGYAENGQGELTLKLYAEIRELNCAVDARTYMAALKACANLASLASARQIHAEICKVGAESDSTVATSLIDAYGKCGSMLGAQNVFDSSYRINPVTWNALVAGYSHQGDARRVFDLFHEMVERGTLPEAATFVSVLAVCSHAGLVELGLRYFGKMVSEFGIAAGVGHYHCVIDLLGRANRLEEAMRMVEKMPVEASPVTWRILLGACYKWKHVEIGEAAFAALVRLQPQDASAYTLMDKIYKSGEQACLRGS